MNATAKRSILAAGCLLVLATAGCGSGPGRKTDSGDTARNATIEHASVTVYPVVLAGHPRTEVARVVALMLERGGVEQIEVGPVAFRPDADSHFDQQSQAFAAFAARQPTKTDYALYGAYLGSPARGVDEVRGVLVDGEGKVVWSDRQQPGDPDFERLKPDCPMTCSVLLVERLRKPLHLTDPFREDAPRGALARRFERQSGIPDKTERAAIERRLAGLRDAAPKTTVAVYPVRAGDEFSRASAEALVGLINDKGLLSARAAAKELRFEFTPSMNLQKVLWSGARSIQGLVRQRPADADYVLLAHYVIPPGASQAFAVHLYLLDRAGEFVIVDYQNSHHEDFQRIKPSSREDCSKLALVRLAGYLE